MWADTPHHAGAASPVTSCRWSEGVTMHVETGSKGEDRHNWLMEWMPKSEPRWWQRCRLDAGRMDVMSTVSYCQHCCVVAHQQRAAGLLGTSALILSSLAVGWLSRGRPLGTRPGVEMDDRLVCCFYVSQRIRKFVYAIIYCARIQGSACANGVGRADRRKIRTRFRGRALEPRSLDGRSAGALLRCSTRSL